MEGKKFRDRKGIYHKKPDDKKEKKRISVYGIYILADEILLVRPTWIDRWEFPGGGLDEGESLIDALHREYREETGFKILEFEDEKLFSIKTKFYADDLDEYFDSEMNYFKINNIGNQDESLIFRDEIAEVKYVRIDELNESNMNNLHFDILKMIGLR